MTTASLTLKNNSLNMSNEFRTRYLDDPINYKIYSREHEEIGEKPERFRNKKRQIKEVDSFGNYRIPADNLRKHVDPTEEYSKRLEAELRKKNELLNNFLLSNWMNHLLLQLLQLQYYILQHFLLYYN